MKKNLSKSIVCLYVAAVVLTLFVGLLIDKTGESGYKVALPLCFVGLVVIIVAYHANNKANESLVTEVDDDSYAVINKDTFAIKVEGEDKDNLVVKLTRKED